MDPKTTTVTEPAATGWSLEDVCHVGAWILLYTVVCVLWYNDRMAVADTRVPDCSHTEWSPQPCEPAEAWNASVQYANGALVVYNTKQYVCYKRDCAGEPSPGSHEWAVNDDFVMGRVLHKIAQEYATPDVIV